MQGDFEKMNSSYIPKQGDIVWLDFDPRAGHEQQGRRPAVIVSNNDVNGFLNKRAMVCPITSTNKGYPFQPPLDSRTGTQGAVLCDQAMFLDLDARHAGYIETIPDDTLREIIDILVGFVEMV
jgi:mRNA interferase MazF